MMFPQVDAAIKAHAVADYPRESCGLVLANRYAPCRNIAEGAGEFKIDPAEYLAAGKVDAIVHSHPDGPLHPSAADMHSQIDCGLPFGIVATDGKDCAEVLWWGDTLEPPPLIGRPFRHGASGSDGKGDCYAAIRDVTFRGWGLLLPEFPRDHCWWGHGENLYVDGFPRAGYRRLPGDAAEIQPEPGDVFLARVPWRDPETGRWVQAMTVNHGGVYVGGSMIFHHMDGCLSRREPIADWARKRIEIWLRLEARPQRPFVIDWPREGA